MTSPRLILASGSPRRRELLGGMGVEFEVVAADVEEMMEPGSVGPMGLAMHNAQIKALAVEKMRPGRWILGADTIIVLGARILGKPATLAVAREYLSALSGRGHEVITGCCLIGPAGTGAARRETFFGRSRVVFRELSDEVIARYLAEVPVLDKAGAYALQQHGDWLAERVEGSRTNILGLPTELVQKVLRRRGVL
jgi:septum formation protein